MFVDFLFPRGNKNNSDLYSVDVVVVVVVVVVAAAAVVVAISQEVKFSWNRSPQLEQLLILCIYIYITK